MKGKKRFHLENFQRVCAVCWNKCSRSARPVEITLIKEFVIENYTSNSVFFPAGICPSCSRNLYEYRRGKFRRILTISSDFNPGSLRETRSNFDCSCRICEIAKSHAHKRRQGEWGPNAQIALQSSTKVMFSYLDVMFLLGCAHSHPECASKRRRIGNHVNLISSSDQSTLEKVISSSIKRIWPGDKNTMQLQTLGKPKSLQLQQKCFQLFEPPFTSIVSAILLICPLPPLHIKLGILNLLIQHFFALDPKLEKVVTTALGIDRKDYHGKPFEGRQCS